ncbi:hypothetical protein [Ferroacidibacillus organovorans]|uniref:Uncharacterized protein n=1 Tax=Ferroacidibacillus organovorans TaxID=1765683 RepID=A0A117SX69_9BACL|nr:hypothetical protein [Ferroacidibacillus organovorans]KUO94923.1 hypothetical protein ATW55_13060 [Ferroacidibacillus organovorans]
MQFVVADIGYLRMELRKFELGFCSIFEPFCLRDKERDKRRKRFKSILCGFAPVTKVPSDKVANRLTPKSTPTIAWFSHIRQF